MAAKFAVGQKVRHKATCTLYIVLTGPATCRYEPDDTPCYRYVFAGDFEQPGRTEWIRPQQMMESKFESA